MSIEINNESGVAVREEELVRLVRHILERMHLHPQTELSIIMADVENMEKLHIEWMDEPGPTDVLSFPMDELRPGTPEQPTPAGLLGDIVLCPAVAQEQAAAAGHSMEEELLLLTTHGVLHLLGYDHADPEEKAEMFGLQRELLSSYLGREAPRETMQ
ncbi:rRNA maturation RNase YbeY [Arthrobacter wenxiniae]|jgi:probable rRNA maturation factor|uniref:Endoribonuclease YbeY n=1 Tax=Arthrobacter wenxiniae TaxID=2713570 RepID=A0A7Y7IKH7_9MICC|nr:rRNA maturation RNase YbeY [Arthrobacter wenxiniae]NVM96810.1 rRNA maturation RNase YbeY [Arthrobacter wenxiniae]